MTHSVILTHEYTDFDALASLLGASLLCEGAQPVLPRQMNRNVREFVHLYRNKLPFVEHTDLPRRRVDTAIFVDTRSANWVRGMDDNTAIRIIDHHPDPDAWSPISSTADPFAGAGGGEGPREWVEQVGATTTMLVERIRALNIPLDQVQATLLALGIYEDTGSLTYRSTTPRDAACVAWLLEPGQRANLDVLGRFLRHPLSEAQRAVYQLLVDAAEHLNIDGNRVVVATATAHHFQDELSTLAHKIRNLYEPDALFLIVDLGDRVQVVARSTTDSVDVGEIAGELGGGGHDRAAAAPVRGLTVAQVRQRVLDLCRTHSRPAVTVRHLMSLGRPRTLSARTPISKAALLMRRYGHEGYPVMESDADGKERLIGIITRQEADRTVGHGLGDAPVAKYMREGNYTVTPDDSVATLRRLMLVSGWGQIPVVNSTGDLIGIVTRTDLIKLWDRRDGGAPGRPSLAQRLQDALPPIHLHLLQVAGREAAAMGHNAYVVGGFVRDLLLRDTDWRVPALDLDIVIEGDGIQLAERLQGRYGGRLVTHRRFGTAKWLLRDEEHPVNRAKLLGDLALKAQWGELPDFIDLVTARTEFYSAPSALPTVERSSIKQDLHRRDFTINTLAVNLHPDQWGQLLDFYNGAEDLRQGRIRALHSVSFVDDPTRILRAVRYEQRFNFHIGERTLQLLLDAVELLDRVSPARVRHELDRILQEAEPEKTLARLDELGVLAELHPNLGLTPWLGEAFARLRAALADPAFLAAFSAESQAAIQAMPVERYYWCILVYPLAPGWAGNPDPTLVKGKDPDQILTERLGLRRETAALVGDLRKLQAGREILHQADLRPSQVVRVLARTDAPARFLFRLLEEDPTLRRHLDAYEADWQAVAPVLDGQDLQRLGIRRGPIFRTILSGLRDARLDGQIHSREEEETLALAWSREAGE